MKKTISSFGKRTLGILAITAAIGSGVMFSIASADTAANSNFESPTYSLGNINGQDGWTKTGPYDAAVTSSYGVAGFGGQSLRISNAVTSGSFGDQTFAKPLANAAGEADATAGTFATGTLQSHFEAQFDIRPMQLSQQPGLFLSVSPDRGDGSRMSYLGFQDSPGGIDVIFYDVEGTTNPANFVATTVATGLSRAVTHNIKFVMDFVNGPSNDVVKIYIDGALVHTGTSWENYYRYDSEASAEQSPRIVKTLLFRAGGTAAPGTMGLGYLIDNVALTSSGSTASTTGVTVSLEKYVDGTHATASTSQSLAFPMNASWNATNIGSGSGSFTLSTTGFNSANPYEAVTANMTSGASYSASEDLTGNTVAGNCSAGKPYALVGYTTGATESQAAAATPSTTTPSLSNITSNQFIIVWNRACSTTPPPPPANAPSIDNNGSTVRVNGNLDFVGRNFGHEENVNLTLSGSLLRTVHADGGGNFSTGSMMAPSTPGTYNYVFKGQNSGLVATSTITVTP